MFIRYRPEFQDRLLALHRSVLEGFHLGMSRQQDEADLLAIDQVYLNPGGEFLLGLLDDQLVAMGGYRPLSPASAELKRMRVRPDLQRQGWGTRLLHELEHRACAAGIMTLQLDTAKRRAPTLAFYQKHGYRLIGSGCYGSVEVLRFEKHLGLEEP